MFNVNGKTRKSIIAYYYIKPIDITVNGNLRIHCWYRC